VTMILMLKKMFLEYKIATGNHVRSIEIATDDFDRLKAEIDVTAAGMFETMRFNFDPNVVTVCGVTVTREVP